MENVIGRAMIRELDEKVIKVNAGVFENHEKRSRSPRGGKKLSVLMDGYEREVIKAVLDKCSWNKTKASNELGISIRSLYYKFRKTRSRVDNQTTDDIFTTGGRNGFDGVNELEGASRGPGAKNKTGQKCQ